MRSLQRRSNALGLHSLSGDIGQGRAQLPAGPEPERGEHIAQMEFPGFVDTLICP
jgi:hypothetical protein